MTKIRLKPVVGKKPATRLGDKALIDKCDEWIRLLLKTGGKAWHCSIPADKDKDPDLLFAELINRFQHLLKATGTNQALNTITPVGAVMEVYDIPVQKENGKLELIIKDSNVPPIGAFISFNGSTFEVESCTYLPKEKADTEYLMVVSCKEVK